MQLTTSTLLRPLTVLRRGDTGTDVRLLQQRLNYWRGTPGLTRIPLLAVDGIFGAMTEAAVIIFQTWLNLRVDGIVGPQTWNQLIIPDRPVAPLSPTSPRRVGFAANQSTALIEGSVVLGMRDLYIVGAVAGQRMQLNLSSPGNTALYEVVTPNETILVSATANARPTLPVTGDYLVSVSGIRGNVSYQLRLEIR